MTAPKVIGLDLSLTCTGVASTRWTDAIKPGTRRGHERLQWIGRTIGEFVNTADLVAVEGPSYGNQGSGRQTGHHERAGLWWLITHHMWTRQIPFVVVPPATLKRYATGKGVADKSAMVLAAARHWKWYEGTADEADALWLAAMAADHLGQPMAQMPAAHRKALDAVTWPDMPAPVVVPYRADHPAVAVRPAFRRYLDASAAVAADTRTIHPPQEAS